MLRILALFVKEPLGMLHEGLRLEDTDGEALRCGADGDSRLRLHPSGEGRERLAKQVGVWAQRAHSLPLATHLTASFRFLWRNSLL